MRQSIRLLRVPLIKFVGGPHSHTPNPIAPRPHPMAPNGEIPGILASPSTSTPSSYVNSNPIEPQNGEFFSRAQLSKRFQYKLPKEDEAENILSGGATLVF